MAQRIVQYLPTISVNQDVARIQFKLENGAIHDANNLPVARFSALILALEASRNAYLNKDNTGAIWVSTEPETPGD